jgi:transposase
MEERRGSGAVILGYSEREISEIIKVSESAVYGDNS